MDGKRLRKQGKGALDIIEEATHLLRLLPVRLIANYYMGGIPFVLGFLYFWVDMGQSPFAGERAAGAAFTLAVLFVWMKYMHVAYAGGLMAHVRGEPLPRKPFLQKVRRLLVQTAIQSTGFVVLPVALLLTFPFGWTMAFYQNVSVFGDDSGEGIRTVARRSWHQAILFPMQNHKVLFIVFLFSTVVFLNVAIAIYLAPHLLKMFFGVETLFTKAGWNVFNTTFLAVAFGITYLLVDPLVKTVYVLRCYYGESLHTGEDLKVELKALRAPAKAALVLLAVSLMWGTVDPKTSFAAPEHTERDTGGGVSITELDRSIGEVLDNREYVWRMPRDEKVREENTGFIATFIAGAFETLAEWLRPAKEWLRKAIEWLVEKLTRIISFSPDKGPVDSGATGAIYVLVYSLLAVTTCVLAIMLWRVWKRRRKSPGKDDSSAGSYMPDITSEEITADVLSTKSWLDLARELIERGEIRLALRALYLGSLSHLAQHGMIKIAAFKSNRDYETELKRGANVVPDLLLAFSQNMRIFESVWYGTHDVTDEIVGSFNENQERVMAFAEE